MSYDEKLEKKICAECNFTFYTHYSSKTKCGSCDGNDNTQVVRSWEE